MERKGSPWFHNTHLDTTGGICHEDLDCSDAIEVIDDVSLLDAIERHATSAVCHSRVEATKSSRITAKRSPGFLVAGNP